MEPLFTPPHDGHPDHGELCPYCDGLLFGVEPAWTCAGCAKVFGVVQNDDQTWTLDEVDP